MSASTSPSTGNGSDMTPPLPMELFGLERPGLSASLLVTLLLFGFLIACTAVARCAGTGDQGGPVTSDDWYGMHMPEPPGSSMTTMPIPVEP